MVRYVLAGKGAGKQVLDSFPANNRLLFPSVITNTATVMSPQQLDIYESSAIQVCIFTRSVMLALESVCRTCGSSFSVRPEEGIGFHTGITLKCLE
jgi:hypothetical protein